MGLVKPTSPVALRAVVAECTARDISVVTADSVEIEVVDSTVAVTMANLRDVERPTRGILPSVVAIMAHRSACMAGMVLAAMVLAVIMHRVSLDVVSADAVSGRMVCMADSNAAMPTTSPSMVATSRALLTTGITLDRMHHT